MECQWAYTSNVNSDLENLMVWKCLFYCKKQRISIAMEAMDGDLSDFVKRHNKLLNH